jgi:oxygen-independent coproporphyrinogen-3 oxidase
MFAVPTQSAAQWRATMEKTAALKPEHISAYCLTYEEDTEFFTRFASGEFVQDEERDAALFESAMDTLCSAGYEQYEISNYALPGRECLHNLAYWTGADYLGIGPSAFSTVAARRWQNIPNAREYADRIFSGEPLTSFEEAVDAATRTREAIAFSLRTNRGVDRRDLSPWPEQVDEFRDLGLLEIGGSRIRLTRRGKMLADSVAEAFI